MAWDDNPPPGKSETKSVKWDDFPPSKDVYDRMGEAVAQGPRGMIGAPIRLAQAVYSTPLGKVAQGAAGRAVDYLGGLVRTGSAGIIGAVKPGENPVTTKDVMDTALGQAPGVGDYAERFGVPAKNIPLPGEKHPHVTTKDVINAIGNVATNPLTYAGLVSKNLGVADAAKAPEVRAAAERLGVTPTEGMLTDDDLVRSQEDSLSQSPSIAGALIRSEQRPIKEAMGSTAEKALADKTSQSPFDAGREMKKSLVDYIESRNEPIKQKYQEIEAQTKNIPVDDSGRARIAKNIGNMDEARFTGSPGERVARQFQGWLGEANTVNDIKALRTKANRIAMDNTADAESRQAASQVQDKLDRFLKNSTKRGAINLARGVQPTYDERGRFISKEAQEGQAQTEGQKIGRQLLQDLGKTDKEYASLMQDLAKVGKGSGISKVKPGKGPGSVINDIESKFSNENIGPHLFNEGDYGYLSHLKEKVPATFEIARQQKLNEIFNKSVSLDGKVDPNKLAKNVQRLGPEVQQLLFGEEGVQGINDIRTLKQSMPPLTGQSGTPRGLMLREILNPVQNINDAARYGLLKSKKYAPKAGMLSTAPSGLVIRGLLDKDR